VTLVGAGRPQQLDDFAACEEVQLGKRPNAGFAE
jgi:hypothetical protein